MFDYNQDLDCIKVYNARRDTASRTRLQIHMGVAPYDGDPHTARVILLMNNPVYTHQVSAHRQTIYWHTMAGHLLGCTRMRRMHSGCGIDARWDVLLTPMAPRK